MTDDKAIEAACEAWYACDEADGEDIAMSAAIAAADKVRAEGFDFIGEGVAIAMKGDQNNADNIADVLRRAFAVGFAKGEADRAALVEALAQLRRRHGAACRLLHKIGPYRPDELDETLDHLVALVRKGV